MKARLTHFLLIISYLLTIMLCNRDNNHDYSGLAIFKDYIHQEKRNDLFYAADNFKWKRNFSNSNEIFLSLLQNQLSSSQKAYVYNQLTYNYLQTGDLLSAESWLNKTDRLIDSIDSSTPGIMADYSYNKGTLSFLNMKPDTALMLLHRANILYQNLYELPHLKRAQANLQLAKVHKKFTPQIDSSRIYLAESLANFNANPLLYAHSLEAQFMMTQEDIVWKSFDAGIARINKLINFIKHHNQKNKSKFLALYHVRKSKLLRKKEQFEKAETELLKGYDIWKSDIPDNPVGIEVLEGKAYFYLLQKQLDSIAIFGALSEMRNTFPNHKLTEVHTYRIHALYNFQKKNFHKCIKYNKKLIALYDKETYPDLLHIEQANYQLVEAYNKELQFDSAKHYALKQLLYDTPYQDSLTNWELIFKPEVQNKKLHFIYFYLYAKVLVNQFDTNPSNFNPLENAFRIFKLCDTLVLNQLANTQEEEASNIISLVESLYDNSQAVKVAYLLFHHTLDPIYLDWANLFIERTKSSILYRDILTNKADYFPEVPNSIRSRELQLKADIQKQRMLSNKGLNNSLTSKLKEQESFFDSLSILYPRYYNSKVYQRIDKVSESQALCKKNNECLLQYYSASEWEYLLFFHPDTSIFLRIDTDSITDNQLNTLRQELSSGIYMNSRVYQQAAHAVFCNFVDPIWSYLEGIDRLIVIPSEKLALLPFEALLIDKLEKNWHANAFLLNHFSIRYAHSLRNLMVQAKVPFQLPHTPNVLAFAFDKTYKFGFPFYNRVKLPPLIHAKKEVKQISATLENADVQLVTGKKATKNLFVENVKTNAYDIIHFAMHAESNSLNQFDNRIYFNGAPPAYIDTLYGHEVIPLGISSSLIVLSSCKSAIGFTQKGEGTFSLARAFIQSGANSVVASLWNIEDQATSEIMYFFYNYLNQKMSPADALQKAKLEYLSRPSNKNIDLNPVFWSILVCY